jgi:hypothetical protein
LYSNEEIDGLERIDLKEAEAILIVINKPIHQEEFMKLLKLSRNKEKIVFIPI